MSTDKIEKNGKTGGSILTERETEVLAKSWLCMKTPPEVDNEKLARLANFGNPRSVANLMSGIKKKIAAHTAAADGEDGQQDGSAPATPTAKGRGRGGKGKGATGTPGSRKRKNAPAALDDEEVDGDGDYAMSTPSKRPKTPRKKATPAAKAAAAVPAADEGVHGDDVDSELKAEVVEEDAAVKEEVKQEGADKDEAMMIATQMEDGAA
ncbi:hypothetical protein MGN70_005832 [Eutypa lata]|nr:hypothetical protein MGN70_005832 [Eutypa lata]